MNKLNISIFATVKHNKYFWLRMNITAQIKQPIQSEMELFEKKFHESMSSKVALLNRITYYIVNRKGKQMRPMFVFLTAKMVSSGVRQ